MAKKQKNELKSEEKLKNVAEVSKNISKNSKKRKPAKKQAANEKTGEPNKNVVTTTNVDEAVKKLKKENKPKSAITTAKTAVVVDVAAKLAKKKAKKLAHKLKQKANKANLKNVDEKSKTAKPEGKKNVEKKLTPTKKPGKKQDKNKEPRIPDPAKQAATLFVGNLPQNTKTSQLIRFFSDYAPVKSVRFRTASGKKLFKHKTRKESDVLIAYVALKDEETAKRAVALNNSEFKTNHLRITLASDKGVTDTKRTVVVGNLKYSANDEKLREIFSSCGEIEYVRCLQARSNEIKSKEVKSGCKGVAYVCFKSAEAVGLALELKDTMLDERPINVERYTIKKQGAFQARKEAAEAQNAAKVKNVKGGKKQKDGHVKGKKTDNNEDGDNQDEEEKKKTVFHGVKIDNIKKNKKNKGDKKLKQIAKKIAPKSLLKKQK